MKTLCFYHITTLIVLIEETIKLKFFAMIAKDFAALQRAEEVVSDDHLQHSWKEC